MTFVACLVMTFFVTETHYSLLTLLPYATLYSAVDSA